MKFLIRMVSLLIGIGSVQLFALSGIATPFADDSVRAKPLWAWFPYDYVNKTNQPLAAGTIYRPAGTTEWFTCNWGWKCKVTNDLGVAFGGNLKYGKDGLLHTMCPVGGVWKPIDTLLRATNPLQNYFSSAWSLRERLKDVLAKSRRIFFDGHIASEEALLLSNTINPELISISQELQTLNSSLTSDVTLTGYYRTQADWAVARLAVVASGLTSLGEDVVASELSSLRQLQIKLEIGAEALNAEPPARALSMIAWDSLTQLFVVFGGDHLDYQMNDVWVFDPLALRWMQRHPPSAPSPRADHWLVAGEVGKVVMKGGYGYAGGGGPQSYSHRGPEEWTYDIATNVWSGSSSGNMVSPETRLYRQANLQPEYYMSGTKPSASALNTVLSTIPVNTWVDLNPAIRPADLREWGTMAFDSARDMIYIYCGGHSGYSGTDVMHYHMSTNRFERNVPMESPLGMSGSSGHSAIGWSFNRGPWMSNHTWNSYDFNVGTGQMLLVGREIGCCAPGPDTFYYAYDPVKADWIERHSIDSFKNDRQGGTNPVYTPKGMMNWTVDKKGVKGIWLLNDTTNLWKRLPTTGAVPSFAVDGSGILYDYKRNRLLMFTLGGYQQPFNGYVYAMDLNTYVISALVPSNASLVSGVKHLREVAYLPSDELFLFSKAQTSDSGHLLYDPVSNLWMSAHFGGNEKGNGYNSGLFYDSKRNLVWSVNTGEDNLRGQVRVLKIDAATMNINVISSSSSTYGRISFKEARSVHLSSSSISGSVSVFLSGLTASKIESGLELAVFDVRGRKVVDLTGALRSSLVDSRAVVQWNSAGESSGVFFLRLICGKKIYVCKALLTR